MCESSARALIVKYLINEEILDKLKIPCYNKFRK